MNQKTRNIASSAVIVLCAVALGARWLSSSGEPRSGGAREQAGLGQAPQAIDPAPESASVEPSASLATDPPADPSSGDRIGAPIEVLEGATDPSERTLSTLLAGLEDLEQRSRRDLRLAGASPDAMDVAGASLASPRGTGELDTRRAGAASRAELDRFLADHPLTGVMRGPTGATALLGGYVVRAGDALPGTRAIVASIEERGLHIHLGDGEVSVVLPPYAPRAPSRSDAGVPPETANRAASPQAPAITHTTTAPTPTAQTAAAPREQETNDDSANDR